MNRHAAAFRLQRSGSDMSGAGGPAGGDSSTSSAQAQVLTQAQHLMVLQRRAIPSDSAILSGAGGAGGRTGLSSGHGVSPGGSPTREETYGLRRALVGEDDALSRSTGKSTTSKGSAARGTGGAGAQATEAQLYDDIAGSAAWNSDHLSPPMLIGQYVVKRRHDQDKQEVLSQVVELDQADMLPIIIACEFSLCVYYARAVLLRAVALAADTSFLQLTDLGAESDSSVEAEEKSADKDASTESSGSTNQVNCRSSGSRAAKLLGMPVLSALLLDSDDDPHVLVDFFKICFKQHVVALLQPDRLLPLISNGNMLGDARDRVPTLSPFVSPNVTKLHSLLARLELRQFQGSEGTLAVEESSIQGLNILSQIVYIAVSCSSVDTASIPPLRGIIQSNSSPISSNLLELQSQLLRNIGVTLSAAETNMPAAHKFVMACKSMLYSLVQDALECLQTASVSKYDRFDWISLSLDRHEKTPDHSSPSGFKSDSSSLLYSSAEGAPPVAYAYWLLRTVLTTTELCNLQRHSAASNAAHNKSSAFGSTSHAATAAAAEEVEPPLNEFSPGRQKNSPYHSSSSIPMPRLLSAFELLTSADTLAKLLQLSSTQNLSLRFCVYDLSALILASVNVTLNQAISKANAEPSVQSPSPQVAASEYYITIAKEKRLLQMFGTRMKAEVLDRRMFTRFTRSVGAFLFQWHLLRRQLGLSSLNYMHEFLMSDLSLHLPSTEQLLNASINSIADLPGADGTPLSPQTQQRNRSTAVAAVAQAQQKWFGLRITQLTSNSVTVDWSLDERIFNVAQLSAQADNEATAQQPLLYEANLYFTAASHMGLETPVLVLSNMEQSGTFHIDDLEADTLYKITISKDNPLNNSSDQEDDENDGEDGGELAMKKAIEMQSRSAAILSYFDNGAAIATPLKDQTDQSAPGTGAALDPMSARAGGGPSADSTMAPFSPSPATLSLKQLPAFPNLPGLQASHVESDIDGGLAFPKKSNKSLSWKESDGELLVVAQDEPESSGNRPEVVLFISTESEEPFKFDSDQMSPNLTVSPHTLTLHNQANKKWSTARASARLTSGLHRWDVHIDRCVSKNIFIGVATRDARLDNYVGCDKHGWAFLANKAVWHNKSKIKAYGELFRTGDTVSVILDLEEGTLSYNLNNKPLGVAMEGLVGPLYPAFSLYNEDDRITVVQVRSATGDGASAGGAGSCAAEKLLERIETLNCLLSVVGEAFRITPPSQQEEEKRQEHAVKVPPFINSVPVTEELGAELLKRWELWKADIPMRSFLIGSDFVTICASASQCSVMSNDLLRLWDTVVMKSELAEVVGVGQHKLWLRSIVTGELFGYTSDTVQLMVEKGMMQIVGSGRQENVDVSSSINQILPMSAWKKSSVEGEQMNTFYSFEVSSVALRDGLVSMQEKWQADDDLALVRFIQTAARKYAESPFDLNIRYILRASAEESDGAYQVGLMETETAALPRSVDVHPLDGVQDTLQILGRKYSQEDVALRVLLLIHLNDLILPLLPVLCPYSNATDENFTSGSGDGDDSVFSEISTEAAINHPTSIIKSVRQLLFSKVILTHINNKISSIFLFDFILF